MRALLDGAEEQVARGADLAVLVQRHALGVHALRGVVVHRLGVAEALLVRCLLPVADAVLESELLAEVFLAPLEAVVVMAGELAEADAELEVLEHAAGVEEPVLVLGRAVSELVAHLGVLVANATNPDAVTEAPGPDVGDQGVVDGGRVGLGVLDGVAELRARVRAALEAIVTGGTVRAGLAEGALAVRFGACVDLAAAGAGVDVRVTGGVGSAVVAPTEVEHHHGHRGHGEGGRQLAHDSLLALRLER